MMTDFYYVYSLESQSRPDQVYTGITNDLGRRLSEHNSGKVPHTSKFRPWRIRSTTAFRDEVRARAFERYLKSGSGRAFLRRHL
jgi:putative endonuclease